MKKKILLMIAILSLIIVVACGKQENSQSTNQNANNNANTTDNEKEKNSNTNESYTTKSNEDSKAEFATKIEEENDKLESVKMNFKGDFDFFGDAYELLIESIAEYDLSKNDVKNYYIVGQSDELDNKNKLSVIYKQPDTMYRIIGDFDRWEKVENNSIEDMKTDRVDYKKLVDILVNILKLEKYELKEDDEEYEIILTDKNFDFIGKFKGQINLAITDIDLEKIDRKIVFKIDKKTLFLKELEMDLDYNKNGKKLDVDVDIDMSNWNDVDKTIFDKVLEKLK